MDILKTDTSLDYLKKDTIFEIYRKDNGSQFYWEQVNIKYVHSLQNLYLCITGNELKLCDNIKKQNT